MKYLNISVQNNKVYIAYLLRKEFNQGLEHLVENIYKHVIAH